MVIIAPEMVLGMLVCLSGCSDTKEFEFNERGIGGFVAISIQECFVEGYRYNQTILYNPDTLVMYSMISFGEEISMTVLYNAEGTPKLLKIL